MKKNAKARTRTKVWHWRPPDATETIHIPLRAAVAKRSVQNILQWNGYLPSDCVRTMVRMGWDYTT